MPVLSKGTDFGATEQVTSTKLDNLVDGADFTDTSGNAVNSASTTGTCVSGGGLEVTSGGQLQVKDDDLDFAKLSDDAALTSGRFGIMNMVYPVGTIYQSTTQSSTPDALFFGGTGLTTWAAVGEGRVLVGKASSGTFDTAGATGGAETVTLTNAQIPGHTHSGAAYYKIDGGGQTDPSGETERTFFHEDSGHTTTTGSDSSYGRANLLTNTGGGGTAPGGGSHTNLQPYEVVYMWKRTA